MLGMSLARRFNLPTTFVSTPQPPLNSTLWDEQLSAARADLHTLADTLSTHIGRGQRCVSERFIPSSRVLQMQDHIRDGVVVE